MKKIVSVILVVAVFISLPVVALSFGASKHEQMLVDILFGDEEWSDPEDGVELLKAASGLAIDQFKGDGENKLTYLQEAKVKDLPESIDDFNLKAGGEESQEVYAYGMES